MPLATALAAAAAFALLSRILLIIEDLICAAQKAKSTSIIVFRKNPNPNQPLKQQKPLTNAFQILTTAKSLLTSLEYRLPSRGPFHSHFNF
ncbi:MAG: hypothetical protein ABSD42_08145 [Candidatus Bathyarchaeia archaeon]|jgi:hypothetical protein